MNDENSMLEVYLRGIMVNLTVYFASLANIAVYQSETLMPNKRMQHTPSLCGQNARSRTNVIF